MVQCLLAPISWNKVEVNHNTFATTQNLFINAAATMPVVGGAQSGNRIGDQISTAGWKVKMLLGQKADRPNVTWRIVCYSIPKNGSINYADVFKNVTGHVLLDEHNTDTTRILYQKYLRPSPSLDGNATFSVEVNPSTTCSGPTGYYSSSRLLCSVHDQPAYSAFEFLQLLFLITVHVPYYLDTSGNHT